MKSHEWVVSEDGATPDRFIGRPGALEMVARGKQVPSNWFKDQFTTAKERRADGVYPVQKATVPEGYREIGPRIYERQGDAFAERLQIAPMPAEERAEERVQVKQGRREPLSEIDDLTAAMEALRKRVAALEAKK